MSYLGRTENKSSDIRRFDVTSSTSATHTLTWTPPNELSLIVTINGVKQHEDAYSVSGTTLTLTSALVAEDKLEVIGINDIGTTITPAQNSVTTAHIQDDAVTADKLANSINTEIAANTAKTGITSGQASAITANTAKVTNATHTGDVTGATALTIATDAVDIAMLSATGTASSSTFLRGDNAWAAAGGGLTIADQWRLTTSFSGTSNPITSNLERVDTAQQATLGSAMTESSGVFTFPETGYYLIQANLQGRTASSSAERSHGINIDVTLNNSTYVGVANSSNSGYNSGDATDYSGMCQTIVDVTATADVKVRFYATTVNGSSVTRGSTSNNLTTFTFIKLADT